MLQDFLLHHGNAGIPHLIGMMTMELRGGGGHKGKRERECVCVSWRFNNQLDIKTSFPKQPVTRRKIPRGS